VLTAAHGVGHEGIANMLLRLHVNFHVLSSHAIIAEFVCAYATCQWNKAEHLHPAGLLQPLEVPPAVSADVALDFINAFPRVHGKSMVLTVVDCFSKYVHFIALGHPYKAMSIARHSSTPSSGFMACPAPSSTTGTLSSQESFGLSYLHWWGSSST
jgi:hypothetical protein